MNEVILWRRADQPGHESARLSFKEPGYQLTGTAVFAYGRKPCRLDYQILCDAQWRTVQCLITGWVGTDTVVVDLSADSQRRWLYNGVPVEAVQGCIDVDLNFSPSTNLLPIRRLNLSIGQKAQVTAAWLSFPDFELLPLNQTYLRIAENDYQYESEGGFVKEFQVNEAGFVVTYPDFWTVETDG